MRNRPAARPHGFFTKEPFSIKSEQPWRKIPSPTASPSVRRSSGARRARPNARRSRRNSTRSPASQTASSCWPVNSARAGRPSRPPRRSASAPPDDQPVPTPRGRRRGTDAPPAICRPAKRRRARGIRTHESGEPADDLDRNRNIAWPRSQPTTTARSARSVRRRSRCSCCWAATSACSFLACSSANPPPRRPIRRKTPRACPAAPVPPTRSGRKA